MSKKTRTITYNLADRARPDTVGFKRQVNIKAWADFINSPDIQHLVASGDMYGYVGHETRARFGLRPPDSFVSPSGDVIYIKPAFRTIKLTANARGDVSAKHEFLDTDIGKYAAQMYHSKAGGFSTAVKTDDSVKGTILTDFAGFDQVLMPNYNTNRGDGTFDSLKIIDLGDTVQFDSLSVGQQAILNSSLESVIAHQYDSIHAMIAAQNMANLHQQEMQDAYDAVHAVQQRQDNIKKRQQSREDEVYDSMLCPSVPFADIQSDWHAFATSSSEEGLSLAKDSQEDAYQPPRESLFARIKRGF